MRSLILCRERLNRILGILDRNGGIVSLRDFWRTYGVHEWEVEQAAELGWLRIVTRKPRVGRPSRVAQKLSECESAKLPPFRCQIPREISIRHWRFALESVSCSGFKMTTRVRAYLRAFPNARSRAGASASASRLMKRRDVRVVRLWFLRISESRHYEDMPNNVNAILTRLRELGLI
jgi:hypothetical protein